MLSKLAGHLIKVAVPLAKHILAPLGTAAADAGIEKKIHGSGTTILKISIEEIKEIMKLFKPLNILIFCWKEFLKQLKTKQKKKMEDF